MAHFNLGCINYLMTMFKETLERLRAFNYLLPIVIDSLFFLRDTREMYIDNRFPIGVIGGDVRRYLAVRYVNQQSNAVSIFKTK